MRTSVCAFVVLKQGRDKRRWVEGQTGRRADIPTRMRQGEGVGGTDRQTETGICRAAGQQGRDKGVAGARRDRQTETGMQEGRQAKNKIRGWGAKGQTDRDGGQSGQQG